MCLLRNRFAEVNDEWNGSIEWHIIAARTGIRFFRFVFRLQHCSCLRKKYGLIEKCSATAEQKNDNMVGEPLCDACKKCGQGDAGKHIKKTDKRLQMKSGHIYRACFQQFIVAEFTREEAA